MAGRPKQRKTAPVAPPRDGYFWLSMRPLHILAFLLPLIGLYELGSIIYLSDPGRGIIETIAARNILSGFFEAFGVATFYLPGIALLVVLLIWHVLVKDRWTLDLRVLGGMGMESALWMLPILILGKLIAPQTIPAAMASPDGFHDLGLGARVTLSVGAGIYEELLFRLIAIAAVHFVVVDLLRAKAPAGYVAAAIVSAAAFALYHDIRSPEGLIQWPLAAFYFAAGLYFAGLYIVRGFGIVVATHALYDIVVLAILPSR
jgi:hypothetical protein